MKDYKYLLKDEKEIKEIRRAMVSALIVSLILAIVTFVSNCASKPDLDIVVSTRSHLYDSYDPSKECVKIVEREDGTWCEHAPQEWR